VGWQDECVMRVRLSFAPRRGAGVGRGGAAPLLGRHQAAANPSLCARHQRRRDLADAGGYRHAGVARRRRSRRCAEIGPSTFMISSTGGLSSAALREDEPEHNRFNDGKADRQGRFWAGSMDGGEKLPTGSLFRLQPNLACHKMIDGIICSDALCWSPTAVSCATPTAAAHHLGVGFREPPRFSRRPDDHAAGCATDLSDNLVKRTHAALRRVSSLTRRSRLQPCRVDAE
jgi:hypothetical protein